jgi:hypothetical protein
LSHFEYVSIATALVSALAVGRLLSGFSPALDESRRYWIHVGWIVALLLVCVAQWWGLWRMREVPWTPVRFLCVLAMPGLLFVQASVLVSDEPSRVESFRVHYFNRRIRFFSVALAQAIVVGLSPWVFGLSPWFAPVPVHSIAVALAGLSVAGLAFERPVVHAILVALALLIAAASFVVASPIAPSA